MSADAGLRVLVVDDHELFRTGLCGLLADEGFEVAECSRGDDAPSAVGSFPADVVVMDLNMPGISGVEATARVLDVRPEASVLMLTINREDAGVIEAIRAGASGYLLKDAELDEIVQAIRAAAAGESVLSPAVAGAVLTEVRADRRPPASAGLAERLSRRELEVLGLIARGCDNAAISRQLFLSQSTVKHHVSRVLEKLGVDNRLQAATLAVRHGLSDEGRGSG